MTKTEKYIIGFFRGANELSPGIDMHVKEVGGYLAFNVVETNPETDCTRTNGYAESVATIEASSRPMVMGKRQAKLVVKDLDLVEPVCP